ncbi:PAS domain-containing sensor histidine kinase [Haloarculaceae archaeon H-GB2-1]|nr:PAS domain-containing sensor histidine kinase [Haloarculaceae archaeon H-GB1-1]MEA5409360.1 PAS domain-containing sensor histidine kinase [Haloarculaceae archaeon H-GB2-1]
MTEEDLRGRLREAAESHDDDVAALLAEAADRLDEQDDRLSRLTTELEETNEGMVALTLELQEAEEKYRSLFEHAVEGIYRTTPDGRRYVVANESMADVLGYETPEALQRAVSDVETDVFVDPDRYEEYVTALRDGETIENFEYRIRRRDGEVRWVSDNAQVMYEDGAPAGFRGGVIDITELKTYEQRLETINDELEALNRVVRHDIRNGMQIIRGFAEVVAQRTDDDRAAEKIITTSDHIIGVTDDAREFIDTLASSEEPQLEPIAFDDLLSFELERQAEAYPEADFERLTEIPSVEVIANEMLSSVVRNLLSNAVNHNDGDDPVVEVAARTVDEHVELRVADNGPGVPDEEKEVIFGKGEQSLDSDGTGIGLYLVNRLVTTYGGEVWVEDRADQDPTTGIDPDAYDSGVVFVVELQRA